jgi:hypothetical protein
MAFFRSMLIIVALLGSTTGWNLKPDEDQGTYPHERRHLVHLHSWELPPASQSPEWKVTGRALRGSSSSSSSSSGRSTARNRSRSNSGAGGSTIAGAIVLFFGALALIVYALVKRRRRMIAMNNSQALEAAGPMMPVQAPVVSQPQMQLIMMVTVPPGVPVGGVFAVATPSGQQVQVQAQVPEGQQMQVQVAQDPVQAQGVSQPQMLASGGPTMLHMGALDV